MRVGVVNYGMGNIGSVRRALGELGAESVVMDEPAQLADVDHFIIPGVGSFAEAMGNMVRHGWREEIRCQVLEQGKMALGICLGMQLLATRGMEHGETEGLDLIPGEVRGLEDLGCALRIPHVGWNHLEDVSQHPICAGTPAGTDFYFVHSFGFLAEDSRDVVASVDYGVPITAVIARGNALGLQHHPEKSAKAGFRQIRNFLELKPC
jgi:glutamine amidotransferase